MRLRSKDRLVTAKRPRQQRRTGGHRREAHSSFTIGDSGMAQSDAGESKIPDVPGQRRDLSEPLCGRHPAKPFDP
jgi:hypothetical protein